MIRIKLKGANCKLACGDSLDILRTMPDNCVDSIVTDPPAGISFMNKKWDANQGGASRWIEWLRHRAHEALRVIKPGGHALVWAIPRTSHWTGLAWEEAGWEPRDKIYHAFGSGFPKSHDVSKAIDKAAGVEREVTGTRVSNVGMPGGNFANVAKSGVIDVKDEPVTDEAKLWSGWGTALKPAVEEWWLFRKPFDGNVADNVRKYGTGAINIDDCRVGTDEVISNHSRSSIAAKSKGVYGDSAAQTTHQTKGQVLGRWPANLVHDGSDEVQASFPDTNGTVGNTHWGSGTNQVYGKYSLEDHSSGLDGIKDYGNASRLFYCPKAATTDREEGLDEFDTQLFSFSNGGQSAIKKGDDEYTDKTSIGMNQVKKRKNVHPTVKSTELMRYFCKLITPPNGIVLDLFMGSGSTGKAAMLEEFGFVGMELSEEYFEIAKARIAFAIKKSKVSKGFF